MNSTSYPPALEAYWLKTAQTETRASTDRDALHRLLPDITRLADRFTTGRVDALESAATPYLKDTRACAAYSLYFAPQTHARMAQVMAALPPFPDSSAPLRILDLGAGTGAATWAALDALGNRPVSLMAVDYSRAALRCLHDVFSSVRRARWPQAQLRTDATALDDFSPATGAPWDLILMHYVLNELPDESRRRLLSRVARSLAPSGRLLLCEPLVRGDGDGDYLRGLRSFALDDLHLHLQGPCPHEAPCPLATPCHCVRTWTLPRSLQILNTTLRRDLRHLAYAWLAFTPSAPSPAATPADGLSTRIIAPVSHGKGHSICPVCAPDGAVHNVQLLHRHFDGTARKALRHLERGEALRLATLEPATTPDAPAKGTPRTAS